MVRVRVRGIREGTSINPGRGGAGDSGAVAVGGGMASTPGGGGQDWKGYLKRKGVEWLFI